MPNLIDTNVLVYRYDLRYPAKREIASRLLRDSAGTEQLVIPHQALVEFVAATTRPRRSLNGSALLDRAAAYRAVEHVMEQFPVVYPNAAVVVVAMRGAAAYQLSWYDAHLWAYAEVNGLDEIFTEDFEHGRRYGSVRAHDPFLAASDEVHELPALYQD
ncbi:MAG: PIN domain-containing protein [Thermoanaerobaculia bacterium]